MMNASLPSLVTSVGLSVTRGRLPGFNSLGWPAVITKDCNRLVKGMPVSPAMTDGSHAPLGVAENALPQRSTTFTQVVSLTGPNAAGLLGNGACEPTAPGRCSREACLGSISLRRSAAYSLESRI